MRTVDAARGGHSGSEEAEVWLRRAATLVVASVAAYASYVHQRAFALQGGADGTSAALWPFSVDGLLLLATAGLLKPGQRQSRRSEAVVFPSVVGWFLLVRYELGGVEEESGRCVRPG